MEQIDDGKMKNKKSSKGTLGTFGGVFTPSILTILGIILFLRLGYVVGNAGLARALIIIGIVAGHLFLLVLFYTLFRGGILKLCRRLFKDRVLAKKYEDYTTLRLLLAVTLIVIYIFIISCMTQFMHHSFHPAGIRYYIAENPYVLLTV